MTLTTLYDSSDQDYMSNTGWWMSSPLCLYCLAALVHRGNLDITKDLTAVAAGGTCMGQCKELATDWAKAYAAANWHLEPCIERWKNPACWL